MTRIIEQSTVVMLAASPANHPKVVSLYRNPDNSIVLDHVVAAVYENLSPRWFRVFAAGVFNFILGDHIYPWFLEGGHSPDSLYSRYATPAEFLDHSHRAGIQRHQAAVLANKLEARMRGLAAALHRNEDADSLRRELRETIRAFSTYYWDYCVYLDRDQYVNEFGAGYPDKMAEHKADIAERLLGIMENLIG